MNEYEFWAQGLRMLSEAEAFANRTRDAVALEHYTTICRDTGFGLFRF